MWEEAEQFLAKDKYIGLLVKKHGPCKIKLSRKKDFFNDLVYAIVGQQLSGKSAESIFERLKRNLGGKVECEKIARTRKSTLRKCGLSNAKAEYVKDLAGKVKNGEVEIYKMNALSNEKIIEELTKIKGIGKWTAEMFLMFSLGRQDVFPVDDLGIKKGIKKFIKKQLISQELENFALRWKPYRTAASWYIWQSLENK